MQAEQGYKTPIQQSYMDVTWCLEPLLYVDTLSVEANQPSLQEDKGFEG